MARGLAALASRGCGLATDQKAVQTRGPGRVVLGSKPQLATAKKLVSWAPRATGQKTRELGRGATPQAATSQRLRADSAFCANTGLRLVLAVSRLDTLVNAARGLGCVWARATSGQRCAATLARAGALRRSMALHGTGGRGGECFVELVHGQGGA